MAYEKLLAASHAPLKRVSVLGATGSIGTNSVDLLLRHRNRFEAVAVTAQENAVLLASQARQLGARMAVIGNEAKYRELKAALEGSGIQAGAGAEALCEAAAQPSDIVVSAIVGTAGLMPTLTAIRRGATVAIANKECLVSAGELMLEEARAYGATLLPVDSEHSALFQVFDFDQPEKVESLTLTASGGPFRTFTLEQMRDVTPEQAVRHPNWEMGAKISVDSATMMNKGLELIEAYRLFPVKISQLNIVIHPESVIHGMVQYIDGSLLAQMGSPDMRTPIAYALGYPERIDAPSPRLDLVALHSLTFEAPDETRFPSLRLAREALAAGGSAPCILNAANEVAVRKFLEGRIGFTDIARIVEETVSRIPHGPCRELEAIHAADAEARRYAEGVQGR